MIDGLLETFGYIALGNASNILSEAFFKLQTKCLPSSLTIFQSKYQSQDKVTQGRLYFIADQGRIQDGGGDGQPPLKLKDLIL